MKLTETVMSPLGNLVYGAMGLMSPNLVPLVPNGSDNEGKQTRFPAMIKDPGQELAETYKALLIPKIPQT